jgi:predicted permease
LSNHVLFILPIAQNLFAGYIPVQISAIIIVDPILIGLIIIFVLEGLRSQRMSLFGILGHLSKNPPVLAVFAGPLMVALAIELPIYLAKLVTFSAYAPRP